MSQVDKYTQAGQQHVYTFYDSLPPSEKEALNSQLATIDPSRVNSLYKSALQADELVTSTEGIKLEPPPEGTAATLVGSEFAGQSKEWSKAGMQAIQQGEVGVLLLAGGQGTRLGSSAPKGCYDIGLPSGKSLFQLQAERIKALQVLAGGEAVIPWYIMTSGPTRAPTEKFFAEHSFFGLAKEHVIFFEQGVHHIIRSFLRLMLIYQVYFHVSTTMARFCSIPNRLSLLHQMAMEGSTPVCSSLNQLPTLHQSWTT